MRLHHLLIICLSVFLVAYMFAQPKAQQAQQLTKWEYRQTVCDLKEWKALGDEGWELAALHPAFVSKWRSGNPTITPHGYAVDENGGIAPCTAFFKRPTPTK
jgi:hypothetical protein